MSTEEIINRYKKTAISHGSASQKGDYRVANKQAMILKDIYSLLGSDDNLKKHVLGQLINDDNLAVSSWAAAHSLGLNFNVKRALKTLDNISKRKDIGVLSFDAEMVLKVWKQKGHIKF